VVKRRWFFTSTLAFAMFCSTAWASEKRTKSIEGSQSLINRLESEEGQSICRTSGEEHACRADTAKLLESLVRWNKTEKRLAEIEDSPSHAAEAGELEKESVRISEDIAKESRRMKQVYVK